MNNALALDVAALKGILAGYRFRFTAEKDLQDGIELALTRAGAPFLREAVVGKPNRPDFMVDGRIAIEVKTQGSFAQLVRQISRYALQPEIDSILVVCTSARMSGIPDSIEGKPVESLYLIGSLL